MCLPYHVWWRTGPQSDLFLVPSGCLSRIRLIYWRNPRSESAIRTLTEFPARLP